MHWTGLPCETRVIAVEQVLPCRGSSSANQRGRAVTEVTGPGSGWPTGHHRPRKRPRNRLFFARKRGFLRISSRQRSTNRKSSSYHFVAGSRPPRRTACGRVPRTAVIFVPRARPRAREAAPAATESIARRRARRNHPVWDAWNPGPKKPGSGKPRRNSFLALERLRSSSSFAEWAEHRTAAKRWPVGRGSRSSTAESIRQVAGRAVSSSPESPAKASLELRSRGVTPIPWPAQALDAGCRWIAAHAPFERWRVTGSRRKNHSNRSPSGTSRSTTRWGCRWITRSADARNRGRLTDRTCLKTLPPGSPT